MEGVQRKPTETEESGSQPECLSSVGTGWVVPRRLGFAHRRNRGVRCSRRTSASLVEKPLERVVSMSDNGTSHRVTQWKEHPGCNMYLS